MHTVESDVVAALGGRSCVAAGRTDKDVSAVSQVCRRAINSIERDIKTRFKSCCRRHVLDRKFRLRYGINIHFLFHFCPS